jgi:hypothetical protein
MNSIAFALMVLFAGTRLHAPSEEQTNSYKIRERVATSEFGSVVMTGVEKRHIAAPIKGKRAVDITFEVDIAEKHYAGTAADKWAQGELANLRESDHGSMDDLDRLTESDGVSVDAYPIFSGDAIDVGGAWQLTVNGQKCFYTLDKLENGRAVISTESTMKAGPGSLKRNGTWTVEVATGRLVSWRIHSAVTYRGGKTETVDSSGELKSG